MGCVGWPVFPFGSLRIGKLDHDYSSQFTYRRLPEKKNIEGRLSLRNHNLIHGEKEFAERESKQKVQESDEITDSKDV